MTGIAPFSLSLLACSVCWGSDANSLDGANAGVAFMLVVLLGVLGGFLSFIVCLARRARRFAREEALLNPQTAP